MSYVFDSGPLIDLFRHYYPNRFPTLWSKCDALVTDGMIVSVREVYREITSFNEDDQLIHWARGNKALFYEPTAAEMLFVQEVFRIQHFQALVRKKERLQGKPVADPFVAAKAKVENRCVVTTESNKPNAARLPNVCDAFGILCIDLETFMQRENWAF